MGWDINGDSYSINRSEKSGKGSPGIYSDGGKVGASFISPLFPFRFGISIRSLYPQVYYFPDHFSFRRRLNRIGLKIQNQTFSENSFITKIPKKF